MSKTKELYKKYRPTKLSEVFGQKDAKAILDVKIRTQAIPQSLLFAGPSGVGKTTLARITAKEIGCNSKYDLSESNCAMLRGIDDIRDIGRTMSLVPLKGKVRVWILDECQKFTKDAQSALLKILEDDLPDHAYFFLCTTEPNKLLTAIRTRCTLINVKALSDKELAQALKDVSLRAKMEPPATEVMDKLVKHANGSAREAIKQWDAVRELVGEEAQLAAISSPEAEEAAFKIATALMYSKPWKEIAQLIKNVDEEPETVRRIILGYAGAVLLNGNQPKVMARALDIINQFWDPWYDVNKAGLIGRAYEVSSGK